MSDQSCGVCCWWEFDGMGRNLNGEEVRAGECEAPVPDSVHVEETASMDARMSERQGKFCKAFALRATPAPQEEPR